jgi:4-diphosphocytidyl-2-C-methyl-D-erythritol kinase
MNRMFRLGLSQKELMERGVKLGADVPYCIMRGTVLAEGIGEQLTPLPEMPKCHVLVAKPPISVSTKMVYENLHVNDLGAEAHPDVDAVIRGLEHKDLHEIASSMGNILERVTMEKYPIIEQIRQSMMEEGAVGARMSGSGPTVFGLFDDKKTAEKACETVRNQGLAKQVYLTSVYNVRRKK